MLYYYHKGLFKEIINLDLLCLNQKKFLPLLNFQ